MSEQKKEYTQEELESMLADRKKADAKKRQKAKAAYEKKRDEAVETLKTRSLKMHHGLDALKQLCHGLMAGQHEELEKYGKVNKKSKGGFSIINAAGDFKVTRRRDTNPQWDERSNKGLALIKEFLDDTVKKAAQKEYEIIMGFLERNKQGDLEYSKVMHLLQHKDNYQDKRWQEGCELVLEGYNIHFKAYNYEFKMKDAAGAWQTISLNFSSI